DAPNSWPPLQYIIMQALRTIPSNLTTNGLPTPSSDQSTYDLVPAGQLALTEAQLPGQPLLGAQANQNATATGPAADINKLSGTVVNGGNATAGEGMHGCTVASLKMVFMQGHCALLLGLMPFILQFPAMLSLMRLCLHFTPRAIGHFKWVMPHLQVLVPLKMGALSLCATQHRCSRCISKYCKLATLRQFLNARLSYRKVSVFRVPWRIKGPP
ncbi:glycoside hydrolase family 37 protein, partial [Suillus brevipes Sb2]